MTSTLLPTDHDGGQNPCFQIAYYTIYRWCSGELILARNARLADDDSPAVIGEPISCGHCGHQFTEGEVTMPARRLRIRDEVSG